MAYSKAEQETILNFDVETGKWNLYTSYPPHIRKYRELVENPNETFDEIGVAALSGTLTSVNVSVRKKRVLTEAQRAELSERAKRNLVGGGAK